MKNLYNFMSSCLICIIFNYFIVHGLLYNSSHAYILFWHFIHKTLVNWISTKSENEIKNLHSFMSSCPILTIFALLESTWCILLFTLLFNLEHTFLPKSCSVEILGQSRWKCRWFQNFWWWPIRRIENGDINKLVPVMRSTTMSKWTVSINYLISKYDTLHHLSVLLIKLH